MINMNHQVNEVYSEKNQQGIPVNENQFEIDPNSPIRKNKDANKIND
jgi:hypothetical protein